MDTDECDDGDSSIDWIDEAIKRGMGFKSEAERKAYVDSLGDPELHPMFATNSKDLIGNPLADGIRALREEGRTDFELAIMYKDEGNELLKNGDYINADSKYAYALTFLDKIESSSDNIKLRSQIISNQALMVNRFNKTSNIQSNLSSKAKQLTLKTH